MWIMKGFTSKLLIVLVLSICAAQIGEALKCLYCSTEDTLPDPDCGKRDPSKSVECPEDAIGCVFKVELEEGIVRRECISQNYTNCAMKVFQMDIKEATSSCAIKENITPDKWDQFALCEGLGNLKPLSSKDGAGAAASPPAAETAAAQPADGASPPETPAAAPAAAAADPKAKAEDDTNAIRDGSGPGARIDVTKLEICFCTGDNCNSMNIVPSLMKTMDTDSGVDAVKSTAGFLSLLITAIFVTGWNINGMLM